MPDHDQDLRDERALRLELEARLAAEVERTHTWRRRAEERAERITRLHDDLKAARRPARRVINLLRPAPPVAHSAPDAPDAGADHPRPVRGTLPVIKVVAALGAGNRPIAAEATPVEPNPADLAGADLVMVDRPGWAALTTDARRVIVEAAQLSSPVPLVYLAGDAVDRPPIELPGAVTVPTLPTFPVEWGRPDRHLPPLVVTGQRLRQPDPELVLAGARGRPIMVEGSGLDPAQASVAARRWAARLHAPWIRLAAILEQADVAARSPLPSLAAILVSNRPDRVAGALMALTRQSRPPDEVIVGLHGIDSDGIHSVVDAVPFPVRVMSFPADMTLGETLNRAIAESSSTLISKIDDDDHYGPGFFEDSTHELVMSGAGVVGKAAMFMYRGDNDTMIVRRTDQDDIIISGIMPGGSLVMQRRVWDQVGFPHRPRFVDALLLDGARRMGEVVVAGNRYEFCLVRHGDGHTFTASSDRFTAGSSQVAPGFDPTLVEVPDLSTS
jgi:hypothetical protein